MSARDGDRAGLVSDEPRDFRGRRRSGAREYNSEQRQRIGGTLFWLLLAGAAIAALILGAYAVSQLNDHITCVCNVDNTAENPPCCTADTDSIGGVGEPLVFQETGHHDVFTVKRIFAGFGVDILNVLESHLNISVLIKSLTPSLLVDVDDLDNSITLQLDKVYASVAGNTTGNLVGTPFAVQTIDASANFTTVDFDPVLIDTHDIFDPDANSFTIPRNGTYEITATVTWFDDATNFTDTFAAGVVGSVILLTPPTVPYWDSTILNSGHAYTGYGPNTGADIVSNLLTTVNQVVVPLTEGDVITLGVTHVSSATIPDPVVAYVVLATNTTSISLAGIVGPITTSMAIVEL